MARRSWALPGHFRFYITLGIVERREGTWVTRKFAPDRNDVHLENRISRGAGWANRCIIVVWDCDRGFRVAVSNAPYYVSIV